MRDNLHGIGLLEAVVIAYVEQHSVVSEKGPHNDNAFDRVTPVPWNPPLEH